MASPAYARPDAAGAGRRRHGQQVHPGPAGHGVRARAHAVLERLAAHPPRSVYLALGTYVKNPMPFTPAVQAAYALDEALAELLEEGVGARIARYARAAAQLRAGFAKLGLACVLPPELRSNSITALRFPAGRTYRGLHDALKARGFVVSKWQDGWRAKSSGRTWDT
jgi:2-aminoethylphosphonate-pyruvate transaminase